MKRKFKRVSKRTLSVILAIMMALSTMFVGIVSVDATNNGDNLYVYYGTESQFTSVSSKPMTYSSNLYTTVIDFTDVAGWTWYVLSISSSDSNRNVYWNDQPTITNNTQKITGLEFQNRDGYNNVVHFQTNGTASAGTSDLVKVTYDITANTITFDPGDTPPTPPTPTTKFSVTGRFSANGKGIDWSLTDNSTFVFTPSGKDDNRYYYETDKTVKELSQKYGKHDAFQFFYIYNGSTRYNAENTNLENCLGYSNAQELIGRNNENYNEAMRFGNVNDTSTETVTLWIEANGSTPTKLWYELSGNSDPHNVTIKSNIKVTATVDGTDTVLNSGGDSETEGSTTVSASTLTLTASAVDYNFAGWKLGEGASIMSGSVTSPTITVKVTAATTITATAITLTPRLSVNSSVAKNTTAKVKPGEQFTLNALSKVGDKTQKATKYTVDFYQYTTDIKNPTHIGNQIEINNVNYDRINSLVDASGNKREPEDGEYLIGNEYTAVLPMTINDAGTYHFYADIKGYDNAGNLTTGEYADVSLGTSRLKDDVVVTVAEPLNKAKAYDSGLWVDVQPSVTDSKIALIKWTNKSGANGNSGNTYTLYVPGGIKLNEMPIYSAYNTLTINGTTVSQGGTYNFTHGVSYNVKGDSTTYTLKVYQSESDSMFTTTTLKNPADSGKAKDGDNLPTKSYGGTIDKVEYNGHFMSITASDGKKCDDVDMEKIKGRGNSSWKASGEVYGKYAYNVKFTSKIKPLKMKEATKAKSWCLLANNMDPSLLRNISIYQTAKLAGLSNVPEYKVADFYNNGEYLGSYLITEKVDVGGSKLVDGETPEDYYEKGTGDGSLIKDQTLVYNDYNINYQCVNAGVLKAGVEPKDFSYLLEFDLEDRAREEHCWFKTPKGQYVVVKAPEDLSKNEMEFIIKKWIDAENAVYTNNYTKMNELMNLDSFADVYLVQEFTKNLDSCATSYFVYWDGTTSKTTDASDVKWEATPIWDYDWALGGYNKEKSLRENPGTDASNKPNDKDGWYAKYKCVTRRDVYENGKYPDIDTKTYNLQAQLANNSDFWNKNVVNAWNSDFYDSITSVYSNNGYLKSAYDANYNSFDMNEKRYGFINSNPTNVWGTVSLDNGKKTPQGAYEYLLDWTTARAKWMNDRLGETVEVSLDSDSTEIKTGESVTLTAKLSRNRSNYPMTYQYYMSTDGVNYTPIGEATTDTSLTTDALTAAGTYRFKVCAMYSTYTKAESPVKTVEVKGESAKLTGVSLSTSSTAVTGSKITLNATPATEGTVTGIIYSYYMSKDNAASADDTAIKTGTNLASCTATVPETAGTYYYYVKATFGETTVTSALVHIEVTEPISGTHDVTVYFKSASAFAYAPKVILNNGSEITMTKDQELGTIYSGALTIYWFKAVLTVDSKSANTLIFKTNRTSLNSSIKGNLSGQKYYFAADDIMNGSEIVDLTSQPEYIRNYYNTPLHMVYSSYDSDKTLGFTNIGGKMYQLGAEVDENGKIINSNATIDTVTTLQKSIVNLVDVSEVQNNLLDVNLDGSVDINDATMIQKVLAGS